MPEFPKIYIAGPLFNPVQHATLEWMETTLTALRLPFYSPRLHSGSAELTPEQRQDPAAWLRVFYRNLDELHTCDLLFAVLTYGMEPGRKLRICQHAQEDEAFEPFILEQLPSIAIPDTGTVWEMGYFRALGKPIVGYYEERPKALNLMLAHGTQGVLCTRLNAERFFSKGIAGASHINEIFDWSQCEDLQGVRTI